MKIKNNSDQRQPVHTVSGVVFIGSDRERDLELTPAGLKLVKASDVLTIAKASSQKASKGTSGNAQHQGQAKQENGPDKGSEQAQGSE